MNPTSKESPSPQQSRREEELKKIAKKRVMHKLGFDIHFLSFLFVNSILWIINLLTSTPVTRYLWALWVTASWGAGLLYHYYAIHFGKRGGFAWHAFSYLIVNLYTIFIYLFTTPHGYKWFLWITVSWGILLLTHGAIVYIALPKRGEDGSKSWLNRKVDKELRKIYDSSEFETPLCPTCGKIASQTGEYCAHCGSKLH